MPFGRRMGRLHPFFNVISREDGSYAGAQLGLITYDETESGAETYQISYAEIGARCDHLADALMDKVAQATNDANGVGLRYVASPSGDEHYLVDNEPSVVKTKRADHVTTAMKHEDAEIAIGQAFQDDEFEGELVTIDLESDEKALAS